MNSHFHHLTNLKTDKSNKTWTPLTKNQAPKEKDEGGRMRDEGSRFFSKESGIKPWSESFDDHPTNGLCLCKLCHWSFDEGIVAIGKKYEVLVSPIAKADTNIPGHILTFHHRPIFYPTQEEFMPGQENIEWHRKTKFART